MNKLLLMAMAALGLCGLQAMAQEVKRGSWAAVMRLNSGDYVRILTADRAVAAGRIDSVSEEALGLQRDKGVVSIARKDVVKIVVRTGKGRGKNLLRGVAIGAGVGGGIGFGGAAVSQRKGADDDWRGVFALAGMGVGAGIGAAVGAVLPDEATVYEVARK
jgi:hypothetical protein